MEEVETPKGFNDLLTFIGIASCASGASPVWKSQYLNCNINSNSRILEEILLGKSKKSTICSIQPLVIKGNFSIVKRGNTWRIIES